MQRTCKSKSLLYANRAAVVAKAVTYLQRVVRTLILLSAQGERSEQDPLVRSKRASLSVNVGWVGLCVSASLSLLSQRST
jgi:hypothetical protein